MTYLLLSLLGMAGLAILFLWLKLKKAALVESSLDNEIDQRAASDKAKIKLENERRELEALEKSKDVKEAIDKLNAAIREYRRLHRND